MASFSSSQRVGAEASSNPGPSSKRHAQNPLDKQRAQLEKLLKDPAKPAYIPPPPKEKTIREAREMMKNVQGSSAGAGSGEFHVYKASRRREYERLKIMDEKMQKDAIEREFEENKRQREEEAEAKTAKNRAKRQKKKEKARVKTSVDNVAQLQSSTGLSSVPILSAQNEGMPLKKRRMVNGKELIFRRPGEEGSAEGSEDEFDAEPETINSLTDQNVAANIGVEQVREISEPRIIIHEDD